MRVIAGTARSMPLITPKGEGTRPTTDRIKETLFNILQCDVPGAVFCDFFAGSGGIGIEALSRGAKHAYFVDNNKEALDCIKKNIAFTKMTDKATVISRDVRDAIFEIHDMADIVFMDPPYSQGLEFDIMQMLKNSKFVNEDTLIIIEADIETEIAHDAFEIVKNKRYKNNQHIFMYKK